jgi:hypothetical protein
MTEDHFRIGASPYFADVRCPKHGNDMKELENGWFSTAWWCSKCETPYKLQLVKMRKWNKEAVEKQLKESN